MSTASTLTPDGRPRHVPSLDGLRGVAILLVLFFHFFYDRSGGPLLDAFGAAAPLGEAGVDLFFVLSGFLITRILLSTKGSDRYFSNFYGRRAVRILPLYSGALLVLFIVWPALAGDEIVPLYEQAWYWLYANNIAYTFRVSIPGPIHFWSLAVEEHFYLVWPLLVAALPLGRLARTTVLLVGVAVATRFLLLHAGFIAGYFTLARMDALAVGCLLAVWERQGRLDVHRRLFAVAGPCLAVGLVVLWVLPGSDGVELTKYTVAALAFGCLLGTMVTRPPSARLNRVLSARALRFTGRISYGMYVLHPSVYHTLGSRVQPLGVAVELLAVVGATYLVSYVVFRFYETPFLKLKKHFEYRRRLQVEMPAL